MNTVALVSSPPLSGSVRVSAPSAATAGPLSSNVAVAPAVTVGATCTVSSVLVAVLLAPLLLEPSVTVQLMVRAVSPPAVGSPLVGLKL